MIRLSFWFALFTLLLASPLFAATVIVSSTDDTLTPNDGMVTLRAIASSCTTTDDSAN